MEGAEGCRRLRRGPFARAENGRTSRRGPVLGSQVRVTRVALSVVLLFAVTVGGAWGAPCRTLSDVGWYAVEPAPTTALLYSVDFVDANTGWVAGAGGTILKTTNGGATWVPQNSGVTAELIQIRFMDANNGWAVGVGGTILKTTNGGDSWTPKPSWQTATFRSVHFVSNTTGWVVGSAGYILKTTNGGDSWNTYMHSWTVGSIDEDLLGCPLYDVMFVSDSVGVVVGSGGLVARTTNGGVSWSVRPYATTKSLSGVDFVDSQTGWAVGIDRAIIKTEDGGLSWEMQGSGGTEWLQDVSFVNNDVGWAVGWGGVILHTEDGGTSWVKQTSSTTKNLNSVIFTDATTGYAAGSFGTILTTTGAGASEGTDGIGIPIAGDTRYDTAIEASKRAYPTGASTVVIATGSNWPDALGGAALAGSVAGPLLLTTTNALPTTVLEEVKRLGATDAYILGGTGAVSSAVENTLKSNLTGDVTRLAGANRYGTANAVADEVIRLAGATFSGDAFIATGTNFPDALGASPLAASSGTPILLAPANGTPYLPAAVDSAVILGGTGAVSDKTEDAIWTALGAGAVMRVGGTDRYDTAAQVADYGVSTGMRWDGVGVATGAAFPDALSGGAMLGSFDSVLLLTRPTSLVSQAEQRLSANKAVIDSVYFIGGTGAVSQVVRDQVEQVLQ